jgi:serine/threonine protein kinase
LSRQPTARAGKKLGRYRIERELGRGGMGVVYLAEDENTGRQIALKTTSVAGLGGAEKSRNQRRQRFVREVQALTQVNHDNVVHVIDAGEADDPDLGWLLFYSMEYVEGETLAQLVQRRGALDPGAAAAVCMQVAAGLGAAHRAGIVHRDVKPANIFISFDGRALIGDFGICKIEGQTQITRRDQLVGTPNYLAPEQILGDPVSPATDVFALGALFYVITMNRPLRSHVDAAALLASAQSNDCRDRMLSERSVPENVRKVIARCLEREPKKRWPDGQHLADALSDFATRIPALRDETEGDHLRDASSTSDRSSPFASLPSAPSGDVLEIPGSFANPNDVEAAALAMLDEVAQRDKKPERQEKEKKGKEAPLPVAKTESTVMFNLRAMEEEQKGKDGGKEAPLPVARTESTVVFKMRESAAVDADETARSPVSNRLDETSIGMVESSVDDPTPVGGTSTLSEDHPVAPPRVRSFDASRPTRAPSSWKLPELSRRTWIALSGAAGAAVGLILVFALAPPSYAPVEETASASKKVDPFAANKRPLLCPVEYDAKSPTKDDEKKAAELRDEARLKLASEGATKRVRELIDASIELNPHDAATFYLLGTYLGRAEDKRSADAYRCTCYVQATSASCGEVKAKPSLTTAE